MQGRTASVAPVPSSAATTGNSAAVADYGLGSDMSELRRQLAEAEEAREAHGKLSTKYKLLESQLQGISLFLSEGSSDLTLDNESGLPPSGAARHYGRGSQSCGPRMQARVAEVGQLRDEGEGGGGLCGECGEGGGEGEC